MNSLKGKTAAVSGAASGIGLASAKALLAAGAQVILIDRDEAALVQACAQLSAAASPLLLDLLDRQQCASLPQRLSQVSKRIDIFHANAGLYLGGDLVESEPEQIDRLIELNVSVVMKNVRALLPQMLAAKSGDIIITSSLAAHFPIPWEPVYAASKWAIDCFVQTTRRQVCQHGVRVGSVSPGPVSTGLLRDWPAEKLADAKAKASLLEPAEIADAIVYMLTRPPHITIRDMIIMPSGFDL